MSHGQLLHHILKNISLVLCFLSIFLTARMSSGCEPARQRSTATRRFSKSNSSSLARETNRNAYLGPTQTHWFRNYGTRNLFLKCFRSLWYINKFENHGQWWFAPPCPNICCHNMGGGVVLLAYSGVGDRHTMAVCKDTSYGARDGLLQQRLTASNGNSAEAEKLCSRAELLCSTMEKRVTGPCQTCRSRTVHLLNCPLSSYLWAVQHGSPLLRVAVEHLKLTSTNWDGW